MFGRDTDRDWRRLGETAPYWGVVSLPEFAGKELHGEARERFFASGGLDLAWFRAALEQRLGAQAEFSSALDFGCGVGRMLLPMRARAGRVAGVDVSDAMRAAAARHLAEAGHTDVALFRTPDEAAALGPYDWVNSYIVLQHIPPRRGYRLIAQIAAMVAPQGALSLHVTAFRDAALAAPSPFRSPLRHLLWRMTMASRPAGSVTMYDYDLSRVLAILARAGLGRFNLEHVAHGGHHGFMIYARRV